MTNNPNNTEHLTTIEAALARAQALIEEQAAKLEELQTARTRMARGTREVAPPTPTLESRIVALLTAHAQDALSVAKTLNTPVGRIKPIMDKLRDAGRLHNIGSEVEPQWQHVLGDNGPASELREFVYRLISQRPFSHRELCIVSGARENRISGVLADLREDPKTRVANLGDGSRGRWLILPLDLKPSPLAKFRR